MSGKILGVKASAEAFLKATDAKATAPRLHPGFFPNRLANKINFGLLRVRHKDSAIPIQNDFGSLLWWIAWTGVAAAVDAAIIGPKTVCYAFLAHLENPILCWIFHLTAFTGLSVSISKQTESTEA